MDQQVGRSCPPPDLEVEVGTSRASSARTFTSLLPLCQSLAGRDEDRVLLEVIVSGRKDRGDTSVSDHYDIAARKNTN